VQTEKIQFKFQKKNLIAYIHFGSLKVAVWLKNP